jgi:hypothetical protein
VKFVSLKGASVVVNVVAFVIFVALKSVVVVTVVVSFERFIVALV